MTVAGLTPSCPDPAWNPGAVTGPTPYSRSRSAFAPARWRAVPVSCPVRSASARFGRVGYGKDVVAGGRVAVLRAGRASGAGFAGFRRAGQAGQCLADVPEPAPDPGWGQAAGRAGPLPGQPDVGGQVAGEPELGVGGDDQPGPPVSGGRIAELRPRPAEDLLEEPERVFDIKAAQECLPGAVDRISGQAKGSGPQPQRFGAAVAGQVIDGQADEGALDDGQLAVVVLPSGAAGEPLVQPAPGCRRRCPVPGGLGAGRDPGFWPGLLPGKPEHLPVPGRPFTSAGRGGAGKYITRSLRSRPSTSTGRSRSSQASLVRS